MSLQNVFNLSCPSVSSKEQGQRRLSDEIWGGGQQELGAEQVPVLS